jgi:thioredoxin-related protein
MPAVPGLILPNLKKQSRPGPAAPNLEPGPPPPASGPEPDILPLAKLTKWYKSPLEARKVSTEQRKPLLIFFAQMWDGACPTVHVNNDLFSMPEFNEFAAANLILTKLQYPVGSPPKTYTEAKLEALKRFKDYFKVTGYPTLIMIDESGRELLRLKGYRRIKDPRTNQEFSTAHVMLDRMKETIRRYEERKRYYQMRIDNLTSQGYRVWTSRAGSTMMGKLVDAKPSQIILKDENGQWRQVHPSQLILIDAEWARRKQAGLIPDKPAMETAAAVLPPPPPQAEVPVTSATRTATRSRRGILGGKPAVP